MNMNMIVVVISLLFNLMSTILGGGTAGITTGSTQPVQQSTPNITQMLQMMYMLGGNVNWYQNNVDQVDYTVPLDSNGWEKYGFAQGSKVRIHGNIKEGLYFNFSIKGKQYDQSYMPNQVLGGISTVVRTYSGNETGFDVEVGPVGIQQIMYLLNFTSPYLQSQQSQQTQFPCYFDDYSNWNWHTAA